MWGQWWRGPRGAALASACLLGACAGAGYEYDKNWRHGEGPREAAGGVSVDCGAGDVSAAGSEEGFAVLVIQLDEHGQVQSMWTCGALGARPAAGVLLDPWDSVVAVGSPASPL